jgi:crotonobetainyl-CoA:carnitine CoA-transferase CaiB-like acyl-CoA transferase
MSEALSKGAAPRGPLTGIRVLDLSAYIAGPYGCTLLADMGAEVIKIEPPSGDNLRRYPSTLEAESRAFLGINRSKRGLVLDLKKEQGLRVLNRMLDSADVLVHNFRPSVAPRLGIAYERFQASHPRLIYCVVNGYGESGPMKDYAGYDQVLQAMTGICAMQGKHGQRPEIVYGSVVDYYAAAMVASGVSAALYERERNNQGQYVGISLLRSALAMQSARFIWAESESREIGRDMRSGGVTGLHPAREGFIYLSANTPHFWRALCEKVGLHSLADDPRFDSVRKRADCANEILPQLHKALLSHTALEWEQIFAQDVPSAAARSIADMFDHPQVLAEEMVTNLEHPSVGRYKGLTKTIKFSKTPGPAPFAAPTLGEHSDDVLAECGYSHTEIAQLRLQGVIK